MPPPSDRGTDPDAARSAPDDVGAGDARLDASAAGWSAAGIEAANGAKTWAEGGEDGGAPALSGSRYTVGGLIGQGGMGRVYAATDVRLGREVALKEALPGTEARLAREARVTARLDHPNIVPVHDVGRSPEGRSFYAMRLVRGRSLADALSAAPDAAARLRHVRTLLAVADAMAFAHARGVVHRDLKPANILVGEFGETQVMDWGVARVLGRGPAPEGAGLTEAAHPDRSDPDDLPDGLTRAGGVVGTPRYMSPEQARGEPVDARADVWSLGAILYEILAGTPPFSGSGEAVLAEARRGIVPPLRERAPNAPPELVAIAERALRSEADTRYPTARAFAADVEAWLDGRRVDAHVYTPRELLERLVRRWRVPLAVGGVAALLLAAGAIVGTARVVAERDRARLAESTAAGALTEAEESLARALVARALGALEAGDQPAAELAAVRALTLRESAEARGVLAAYGIGERPRLLSRADAPTCDTARVNAAEGTIWCDDAAGNGLWDTRTGGWRWRVEGGPAQAAGTRVYVGGTSKTSRIPRVYDRETGAELPGPFPPLDDVVIGAARGGGALLADATGGVRVYAEGVEEAAPIGACPDGARAHVGRAEGAWQVVACYDGALLVWGEGPLRTLPPVVPSPTALAILGDTLVVGGTGGGMAAIDLRTGAVRAAGDSGLGPVRAVEAWPGGPGVAVLGDRGVGWWDTETATLHLRLARRDLAALGVRDGSVWVVGSALEEWAAPRSPPARVLRSPDGVGGVAIDASGERVLAYGGGGGARVWSAADGRMLAELRVQDGVTKAAGFTADGGVMVAAATPPGLVWHAPGATDGTSGRAPAVFRDARFKRALPLRTGWTALFGYGTDLTFVRDGAEAADATLQLGGAVADAYVVPDGSWGVAADVAGGVYRIEGDPPTARKLFSDPSPGAVAASSDGRVVVITQDEVRVYAPTGARIATFEAEGLRDVAMSPDGRWVAAGSAGGLTYVWDADAGVLRAVLHGHDARVQGVAFSPDGRWLATGSWDGTTRRWGLDVLDADPKALQATLEVAWGRTLEDVQGP